MWYTYIDEKLINNLNKSGTLLDFGCGDGGYSRIIKDFYSNIDLFDFEEMVKEIPLDIKEIPNVNIFFNWEDIKVKKYDEIIASLVFQHIHPKELDEYLLGLSLMSERMVVKSRPDFNPYIRKNLGFKDDYVLPYINKYFDTINIEYFGNNEIFIGSFCSKNKNMIVL